MSHRLGNLLRRRVAPPRFVLFVVALIGLFIAAVLAGAPLQVALLASFDLATLVFLVFLWPLLNHDTATMRSSAAANDANRVGLLAIAILLLVVVLIAVGTLVADRNMPLVEVPLILSSLILAWIFANTVFALHYAICSISSSRARTKAGSISPT